MITRKNDGLNDPNFEKHVWASTRNWRQADVHSALNGFVSQKQCKK